MNNINLKYENIEVAKSMLLIALFKDKFSLSYTELQDLKEGRGTISFKDLLSKVVIIKGKENALQTTVKFILSRSYHWYANTSLYYWDDIMAEVKTNGTTTIFTILDLVGEIYDCKVNISDLFNIINSDELLDLSATSCSKVNLKADIISFITSYMISIGKFDTAYKILYRFFKENKNVILGTNCRGIYKMRAIGVTLCALYDADLEKENKYLSRSMRDFLFKYTRTSELSVDDISLLTDSSYKKYHEKLMKIACERLSNNPIIDRWRDSDFLSLDFMEGTPDKFLDILDTVYYKEKIFSAIKAEEDRFIRICKNFIYNTYSVGRKSTSIKRYIDIIQNVLDGIESNYNILDICDGLNERVYSLALEAIIKD